MLGFLPVVWIAYGYDLVVDYRMLSSPHLAGFASLGLVFLMSLSLVTRNQTDNPVEQRGSDLPKEVAVFARRHQFADGNLRFRGPNPPGQFPLLRSLRLYA